MFQEESHEGTLLPRRVAFEAKGSVTETVLTDLKMEGSCGEVLRQAIAAVR